MEKVAAQTIVSKITTFLNDPNSEILYIDGVNPDVADLVDYYLELDVEGCNYRFSYNSVKKIIKITMPGELHEAAAGFMQKVMMRWAAALPLTYERDISIRGSPRFKSFMGRYGRSRKEPDWLTRPVRNHFPSVVLEAGVYEEYDALIWDKDLWLHSTNDEVKVVLVVKFKKHNNGTVDGFLEKWRSTGVEHYEIFPVPSGNQADPYITLGGLYGGATPAGSNPLQQLPLPLALLRDEARDSLNYEGLSPAVWLGTFLAYQKTTI